MTRSSSSRELGSIQCTSSKSIRTGCCRAEASSCRSSTSKVFSFLRWGVSWREGNCPSVGNDSRSASSTPSSGEAGGEHGQLVQLHLGRVLALEPGGALELRDGRVECAVLVVRGAETAQAGVRLVLDPLVQGGGETRLANARLAREQHHPTFTIFGAMPLAQEQVDLFLTPDQRREHRPVQRLEPA